MPVIVKQPDVTAEDNAEAKRMAETMISGDVTLVDGDEQWTLTPEQIGKSLGFKAGTNDGVATLVPFVDPAKLESFFDEVAPEVLAKPVDASFDHDSDRVWVVEGKDGKQLDREATAEALTAASLESSGRVAAVMVKTKEPARTTAEAEAMGIKDRLASYRTVYDCEKDRQINVKTATKYATDVFLAPGESYDFDKRVGPRTTARGFKPAVGITGPGKLEDVLGGGICQVSTTMFNAVAGGKAGLKITERRNHSIFIAHYPLGQDATVTDGGKNLCFVNDTKHYIWITGKSNGVSTTIAVWGTDQGRKTQWKIGDFYGEIPMQTTSSLDRTLKPGSSSLVRAGQKGRSLKTTRTVTENGKVIHKDVWTNVWPMYSRQIAVGPKAATTTTEHDSSTTTTTDEEEPTTTTTAP